MKALKRHGRGRRVLLVWDGLPAHKSQEMKTYLASQRHWIRLEQLPGYAPELNPVEPLWGNIKGRELANLGADPLDEVAAALNTGMARVRRHPALAQAFLAHAGLSL